MAGGSVPRVRSSTGVVPAARDHPRNPGTQQGYSKGIKNRGFPSRPLATLSYASAGASPRPCTPSKHAGPSETRHLRSRFSEFPPASHSKTKNSHFRSDPDSYPFRTFVGALEPKFCTRALKNEGVSEEEEEEEEERIEAENVEKKDFWGEEMISSYASSGSVLFGVALSTSLLPLAIAFSLASGELAPAQAVGALESIPRNPESLNPVLNLISLAPEPPNALSLPTWAIHVSSVVEWVTAIMLVWKFGQQTKHSAWQGLAWGMVPSLTGAMCACTWHFYYNDPRLEVLVALQSFMTVVGNFTMWFAAYRIYKQSQTIS